MLKCFVDDSGSDPKPDGIYVLAGYIMEEKRWEDFAERWDTQLKRTDFFPIDYFKMADADVGNGLFAGIDLVLRHRKIKDLALVIKECRPEAIACCMKWKDYNENVKGKVDPRLDNPYAILFFKVMAIVSELQIRANRLPQEFKKQYGVEIKPVEFIFDDQGPAGLKCLQWHAGLRERVKEPHRTMIANTPQFKDDREQNPLQAADMLAWHIRRYFHHPEEEYRADIFGCLQTDGVWQYDITPKELADIADTFNKEIDPLSI